MARNGSRAGTAPWYRSSTTWVEVRKANRVRSARVITGTRRVLASRMLSRGPQRGCDHGEDELARAGLRSCVQEVAHLGQPPGTLGLRHDQEIRVRRDGGQQRVSGPRLPVLELGNAGWLEVTGPRRGQAFQAGVPGAVPPPPER